MTPFPFCTSMFADNDEDGEERRGEKMEEGERKKNEEVEEEEWEEGEE